jgi:hypothetical protein
MRRRTRTIVAQNDAIFQHPLSENEGSLSHLSLLTATYPARAFSTAQSGPLYLLRERPECSTGILSFQNRLVKDTQPFVSPERFWVAFRDPRFAFRAQNPLEIHPVDAFASHWRGKGCIAF